MEKHTANVDYRHPRYYLLLFRLHPCEGSIEISARISDMRGRCDGSKCQHNRQTFHHSFVKRKEVASSDGRGWPLSMRGRSWSSVLTPGKGLCRVKSSFSRHPVNDMKRSTKDVPRSSFRKPRHPPQQLQYRHLLRQV